MLFIQLLFSDSINSVSDITCNEYAMSGGSVGFPCDYPFPYRPNPGLFSTKVTVRYLMMKNVKML